MTNFCAVVVESRIAVISVTNLDEVAKKDKHILQFNSDLPRKIIRPILSFEYTCAQVWTDCGFDLFWCWSTECLPHSSSCVFHIASCSGKVATASLPSDVWVVVNSWSSGGIPPWFFIFWLHERRNNSIDLWWGNERLFFRFLPLLTLSESLAGCLSTKSSPNASCCWEGKTFLDTLRRAGRTIKNLARFLGIDRFASPADWTAACCLVGSFPWRWKWNWTSLRLKGDSHASFPSLLPDLQDIHHTLWRCDAVADCDVCDLLICHKSCEEWWTICSWVLHQTIAH